MHMPRMSARHIAFGALRRRQTMKLVGKRYAGFAVCLSLFASLILAVSFFGIKAYTETPEKGDLPKGVADCINDRCIMKIEDRILSADLLDNRENTYRVFPGGTTIEISSFLPIGGIYIKFDRTPPKWVLTVNNEDADICGQYGFLHEFQKIISENAKKLTLYFEQQVSICDIYVFSQGSPPPFVQVWRPPTGRADIMLFSTHSDDDQLFFAGAIPDAVAKGAEMQVCYFTNHWNTHTRPHELLNGLWTCGLDRYPIVGDLPDTVRTMSEKDALLDFNSKGFDYDTILASQVELLRKYKPQIILVHDFKGEYGHGAHILNSHTCREAVVAACDSARFPDSYRQYGVWDTPKTYIHLYWRNAISCDIDTPLEYFGGKTAYQVSQQAFLCHISQLPSRYTQWLLGTEEKPITKSSEFYKYSPKYYGLWRSTVGPDIKKTDFYENIVLYRDQKPDTTSPSNPSSPSSPSSHTSPSSPTSPTTSQPAAHRTAPIFAAAVAAILLSLFILGAIIWILRRKEDKRRPARNVDGAGPKHR